MAKLQRYLQKIFANNSNQVGVFGTGVDKETSKNVETLQSADYEDGWSSAIITNKNYPIWQERDGVDYGFSYQLAYLMQAGLPEWLSTETYYTNSFCRYGNVIYYSLQDNNTNHNPALNDGYWEEFSSGSSRNIGEIVASTIPLTDAGLHLLDGALIQGSGSYSAFVDYIADLYNTDPTADYFAQDVNPQPESFVQPVLSSNGTLGGNAFAVAGDSTPGEGNEVWQAFDNNASTWWAPVKYANPNGKSCIFYNPKPFNITQIQVKNRASANIAVTGGIIYGSNDNSTWTELTTFTNSSTGSGATWTIDLSSNTNYYKYYKFYITGGGYTSTASTSVASFDLTATYLEPTQTAEEWWQEQVTTYGVCGKFVYDSVNNTVRLPKYGNQIITKTSAISTASTVPVVGNGVTLGLTNGTNTYGLSWNGGSPKYYATLSNDAGSSVGTSSGSNINGNGLTFGVTTDPTKSGLVADISSIKNYPLDCYYYIVIATTTKTSIQVDIDEIATDLNGKMDTDGTNAVSSVKFADGQWVSANISIISSDLSMTLSTTYEYTIVGLPNDNNIYEILVCANGETLNSGTIARINVGTSIIDVLNFRMAENQTRATGPVAWGGNALIPIGTDRKFYIRQDHSGSGCVCRECKIVGYRRVGTNQ